MSPPVFPSLGVGVWMRTSAERGDKRAAATRTETRAAIHALHPHPLKKGHPQENFTALRRNLQKHPLESNKQLHFIISFFFSRLWCTRVYPEKTENGGANVKFGIWLQYGSDARKQERGDPCIPGKKRFNATIISFPK